ncbi:hypothetical protein ACFX2I_021956 [Malus domestica]
MTRCRFKFHSGTHVSLRTCRLYVLPSTSTAKSPPIFAEHHFTRCFCVLCCASRDFEEPIFGCVSEISCSKLQQFDQFLGKIKLNLMKIPLFIYFWFLQLK